MPGFVCARINKLACHCHLIKLLMRDEFFASKITKIASRTYWSIIDTVFLISDAWATQPLYVLLASFSTFSTCGVFSQTEFLMLWTFNKSPCTISSSRHVIQDKKRSCFTAFAKKRLRNLKSVLETQYIDSTSTLRLSSYLSYFKLIIQH